MLILLNTMAFAFSYTPVKTSVSVEIEQGGTAVIIPEVNCPIPERGELRLADREIGRFDIEFSEPGVYTYTVKVQPDGRTLDFDATVYTVRVFITDENGELQLTSTVFKNDEKYAGHSGSDGPPDRLLFVNALLPPDGALAPQPPPSPPPEEEETLPPAPPPDSHNPKTSDDTDMELWFLVAMIASAGLLALSVVYSVDTNKMIKNKNKIG